MMNKLGALLFAAVAAQALPVNAQDASRTAPSPGAQAIASQTPNDAADSDATGSIGKRPAGCDCIAGRCGPRRFGSRARQAAGYLAEAFRNWRPARCSIKPSAIRRHNASLASR